MDTPPPPATVCLYSKYSERCVVFFQDMAYLKGVRMLCVDNQAVRELLEKDDCRYEIQEVPCILVFFRNGRMDKYEGEDAFAWLHDRKQRLMTTSQRILTSLNDSQRLPDSSSITTPIPTTSRLPDPPIANGPSPQPIPTTLSGPSSPPVGIVPPPYDDQENPISGVPASHTPGDPVAVDVPISERLATDTPISTILKKKENIMSFAMSMAKQREAEFEANDPKKRAQDAAAASSMSTTPVVPP